MLMLECSPPFQWKPSYVRVGSGVGSARRVMWAWFAIAYVPGGFNEIAEGYARAGADLYRIGELKGYDDGEVSTAQLRADFLASQGRCPHGDNWDYCPDCGH